MGWRGYGYDRYEWAPYVPVAKKIANAVKHAVTVAKKQRRERLPVTLEGRKISTTFWGKAWCDNLESYSDYANRLPRGATYVRNGSVVDLVIKPRLIEAIVAGSEPYDVKIVVDRVATSTWTKIISECSAAIESLLDLLAGRLSDGVMQRLTRQKDGLFPTPREIKMSCSCPDGSYCCKHLAAVMYGVGSRLDKQPELLFLLREIDHQELASHAITAGNLDRELTGATDTSLAGTDLGTVFGIELDSAASSSPSESSESSAAATKSKRNPTKRKRTVTAKRLDDVAATPPMPTTTKPSRRKQGTASQKANKTRRPKLAK